MRRLLQGSGSNILRLAFVTAVSVVIPPVLTGTLSSGEYSTWVIILQVSSYVGLLDIGLQTVVARFVAEHHSKGAGEEAARTVYSAMTILAGCAALGFVAVGVAASTLPLWLPDLPRSLQGSAQLALLLVGWSSALTLPFGPFLAAFLGIQRYGFPTLLALISRALSAVFIILGAYAHAGLVPIASGLALANLATGFTQLIHGRRVIRRFLHSTSVRPSRSVVALLLRNGGLLAIWTLSGVLVNGVDLLIVGNFDFKSAGAFSIAASAVNFMVLTINSLFSPILPAAAAVHGSNSGQRLAALTLNSTRYCSLLIFILGGLLAIFAYPLLVVWVGRSYASSSTVILQVLVLGHGIRQLGYAYSLVVVARGKQLPGTIATVGEALVNIVASIALTSTLGAIGAAIGTVIGAVASISLHLIVSMRATRTTIPISRRRLGWYGFFVPLLAASPLALILPFYREESLMPAAASMLALVLTLSFLCVVLVGVKRSDFSKARQVIVSSPILNALRRS